MRTDSDVNKIWGNITPTNYKTRTILATMHKGVAANGMAIVLRLFELKACNMPNRNKEKQWVKIPLFSLSFYILDNHNVMSIHKDLDTTPTEFMSSSYAT